MTMKRKSYAAITKYSLVNLPGTVRQRRDEEGLTLRNAAAQIGISKNTVLRIERGQDTSTQVLVKVFAWLDGEQ